MAAVLMISAIGVADPVVAEARAPQPKPPAGTARAHSEAAKVLNLARRQVGKKWVLGATGMRTFDCSGFVYRVYKMAGLIKKVGGYRMGATGYWNWFRRRGLADRRNPKPGDLLIWRRGEHVGIYVGKGIAIDATPSRGVGYRYVYKGWSKQYLTAVLHVRITR